MENQMMNRTTPHEIIEDVLEIKLLPYQKEFIDKAYEAAKEHKQIIYIPSRRSSNKYFLTILQSLAITMAARDEGIIKKEIIRNEQAPKE